jgi:hypothetical protein
VAVHAAAMFPIIFASIIFGAPEIEAVVVASAFRVATAIVAATTFTVMGLSRGDNTA